MGIENLEKIIREQQRGKEGKPEFMIGEQLLDMARRSPLTAELLEQDLEVQAMNLTAAALCMKNYADEKHKKEKGNCVCIDPLEAEQVLRKFYHIPEDEPDQRPQEGKAAKIVDLADFL